MLFYWIPSVWSWHHKKLKHASETQNECLFCLFFISCIFSYKCFAWFVSVQVLQICLFWGVMFCRPLQILTTRLRCFVQLVRDETRLIASHMWGLMSMSVTVKVRVRVDVNDQQPSLIGLPSGDVSQWRPFRLRVTNRRLVLPRALTGWGLRQNSNVRWDIITLGR